MTGRQQAWLALYIEMYKRYANFEVAAAKADEAMTHMEKRFVFSIAASS